jgi:hypothetical protein
MENNTEQLKKLTQIILKSPDAGARQDALLEIRKYNHPNILNVLEYVAEKDRSREVRDLAKNLLTKKRLEIASVSPVENPLPIAVNPVDAAGQNRIEANSPTWKCPSCGADNRLNEASCRYCGTAHSAAISSDTRVDAPDPSSIFVLNPGHTRFLKTGDRRLLMGSRFGYGCTLLFMLPFLLAGIALLVGGLWQFQKDTSLNAAGVVTTGRYIDRYTSTDSDDDTSYYVVVQFQHQGQNYTHTQSVSNDYYNRAEQGGKTNIRYLPTDPTNASLADYNSSPALPLIGFGVLWNVAIVWIIWNIRRTMRQNRTLALEGRLVDGNIVAAKGKTDSDNDYIVTVEYDFRSPGSGQRITKRESATRNDLKGEPLPGVGAPVKVLYRDDRHFKLL